MNTREKKAQTTKKKIYRSALNLIRENGYKNIKVEDITNSAGIAKGSFYSHFSSKEDLLLYTYIQTDKIYFEAYNKVKEEKDFNDMIGSFIFLSYREVEKLGKEMIEAICTNLFVKRSKNIVLSNNRDIYKSLSEIIEYGKKSGAVNKDNPTQYYLDKIRIMLLGIDTYWCLINKETGLAELAEENIRTLVSGFK